MLTYLIRNHDCHNVAFTLAILAELAAETISTIVLEQADLIVAIRFRATPVNDLMLRILANTYEQEVYRRSKFLHESIYNILCKVFMNEIFNRKTETFRFIDTIGQQLTIKEGRELISWEVIHNDWDFLDSSDRPVHSLAFFDGLKK
jgi:hypothetical protein